MARHVLFLLCLTASLNSAAAENPASFSVNDIFLQSSAKVQEGNAGGLDFPQWKFGALAKFSPTLELNLSLGSPSLLYLPSWSTLANQGASLLDVKAQIKTSVADFYAGQFLTPFGLEGTRGENELFFPRSFLYERGLIPLRDYGVGIFSQNDGFYFNVAAHSGEGANYSASTDSRLFGTGQWGYETPTHEALGLSIIEGRVINPLTLAETKLRGGNLFFKFHLFKMAIDLEGSIFQSILNQVESNYLAWHGDFSYIASDSVNIIARYEQYNPNTKISSNVLGRGYFGIEWHGKNSFSRLFIYLVKNNESLNEMPNDEVRFVWRITPL